MSSIPLALCGCGCDGRGGHGVPESICTPCNSSPIEGSDVLQADMENLDALKGS